MRFSATSYLKKVHLTFAMNFVIVGDVTCYAAESSLCSQGAPWLRAQYGAPPLSQTDVRAKLGHPLSQ